MKRKNFVIKTLSLFFALGLCLYALCPSARADMLCEIGSDEFDSARDIIARVADTTAPGSSYVARLGICAVVVNRVRDPRFPSDIYSVVFERGEFDSVGRADFFDFSVSELSMRAARDALLGFDVTRGAVYFRRGYPAERSGAVFYHDGFLFYR